MELLVHFTNYINLRKIIKSHGLRFGDLHKSNDPFEHNDLIGDEVKESRKNVNNVVEVWEDALPVIIDRSDSWEENFQRYFKTLCFSYKKITRITSKTINDLIMQPRMWAQYANNKNDIPGVALIIDKIKFEKELLDNDITHKSDLVSYDLNPEFCHEWEPRFKSTFRTENLEKVLKLYNQSGILFKKHEDWKTENEFRYIIKAEENENLIVPIESSLVAIVTEDLDLHKTRIYEIAELLKRSKMKLPKLIEEIVHDVKWNRGFAEVTSIKEHARWAETIKPTC